MTMPITVELSEREMAELKELTQQQDPSAAVRLAAVEYVRYLKRMRLKEASGQVEMEDNWRSLENAELRSNDGR